MKNSSSYPPIQDDRNRLAEGLRGLNPRLCLVIGLVFCAVASYYVPLILIALTGVWVNNLTMLDQLMVGVIILVIQNLIGNRFSKIILVGIAVAVVFDLYEISSIAHTSTWSEWHGWWPVFFLPTAACLLNAWLFLRYKAAADLN